MRILFICSSLEPGKDGVGDYTRRLACALNRLGHAAAIIALNDRRMDMDKWKGKQSDDTIDAEVLRLSPRLPWKERIREAREFAALFDPGWISLQYVPFGFHLKGLPFHLGKKLKHIDRNVQWQIMFHELSVKKTESLKFRLWAILQERIIRSLIRKLQPAVISTNTEIYRHRLEGMGFATGILPLFSNIRRSGIREAQEYNNLIPEYLALHRNDYLVGTLFGSFDPKSWDLRSLLNKFCYGFTEKRVIIASVGRMPSGQAYWDALQYEYPQVLFLNLGEMEPSHISHWLCHYTDFGILTTLPELAGKSGSFMTFKEHGIPVVCRERTTELKQYHIPLDGCLTEVKPAEKLSIPPVYNPVPLLDAVAEQFVVELGGNDRLSRACPDPLGKLGAS